MASEKVLVKQEGPLVSITLNRPEQGNTVDAEAMDALIQALGEVAQNESCRILLLRGAGPDFCLGRDPGGHVAPPSAYQIRESLKKITTVNSLLSRLPAITIAIVQGRALGFGCGLATRCDITVAADTARFGFPEIKAGLAPTVVLSYLGRWTQRKRAFELIISGREMDAQEAERLGLVNRVVPREGLEREVEEWVSLLLASDPVALKTCKEFLNDIEGMSLEGAAKYAINLLATMLSRKE